MFTNFLFICFKNGLFPSRRKTRKFLFICFKNGLFPKEVEEKHETRIKTFVYLFQEKKGLFQEQEGLLVSRTASCLFQEQEGLLVSRTASCLFQEPLFFSSAALLLLVSRTAQRKQLTTALFQKLTTHNSQLTTHNLQLTTLLLVSCELLVVSC